MAEDLCGLPVYCNSSDAVQLYNAVMDLFCSENRQFVTEIQKILQLDPDFILAKCLFVCTQLEPFSAIDAAAARSSDVGYLKQIYDTVPDREKKHIDAVVAFSERNYPKASSLWDEITVHYPQDIQAIRWGFLVCVMIGEVARLRDIMNRAIHHCPKHLSVYPYILSMYAFMLEETGYRDTAEEMCRQSIAIQPKNPWGIHTICHVIEEERSSEKGVEFLDSCRSDWESCVLSHHIAWHLMLFYLDLNQIDKLWEEYDKILAPRLSSVSYNALLGASSLLWRLNVLGIEVDPSRWSKITDAFISRLGNPQFTWLESHLMMSLCHGKITESSARLVLAHRMIKSMEEYAKESTSSDCHIASTLGVPLCNALLAYAEERYDDAVRLIVPVRYNIVKLGGSWAQRQVFFITLILAAVKSEDYALAMSLILELMAVKPRSEILQKLYAQVQDLKRNL